MVTEKTKFIKHIFNYNVGEVERLVKWVIGLEDDFKDVRVSFSPLMIPKIEKHFEVWGHK